MLMNTGVLEMRGEARQFGSQTFQMNESIVAVGIAFIVIAYPASLLLRALERRLVR